MGARSAGHGVGRWHEQPALPGAARATLARLRRRHVRGHLRRLRYVRRPRGVRSRPGRYSAVRHPRAARTGGPGADQCRRAGARACIYPRPVAAAHGGDRRGRRLAGHRREPAAPHPDGRRGDRAARGGHHRRPAAGRAADRQPRSGASCRPWSLPITPPLRAAAAGVTDRPAMTATDPPDETREPREAREPSEPEVTYVDLLPDELSLARAQLASGLPGLAEGVLRRHIARLDASGRGGLDELDAARALLAEALWRQARPMAAGATVQAIRAGSLERRRP